MEPLAVDPRILRAVLTPDIKLMPGRALMARVAGADGAGRGSLSIAGFIVEAELPPGVTTGQDLRLIVREVSPERILLSLSAGEHAQASQAPQAGVAQPLPADQLPVMPAPVPLPGGGTVQVSEREARGGGHGGGPTEQILTLRYNAPALGAVDLRFALDPETLGLSISVSPGHPLTLAQSELDSLRRSLSQQLGRGVTVTVGPRREPLDLYA
jgi:hypothetical protein